MKLLYITNDPHQAMVAQQAGVDRVMVDLEILGKEQRQRSRDTRISRHMLSDVATVRKSVSCELVVRINPINDSSAREIDECVSAGADRIMLPMFHTARTVDQFLAMLDNRCANSLLLETSAALARMDSVMRVPGIDEIHVGLNDLHLEMRLSFMFELLAGGLIDYIAATARCHGLDFGFGGVGRVGHSGLLPAELILSEHARLGSGQVILSRDFARVFDEYCGPRETERAFTREVDLLRKHLSFLRDQPERSLEANSDALKAKVAEIVGR